MIKKFLLLLSIVLLGVCSGLLAQEEMTVTGVITDMNKVPIEGVSVSVLDAPGTGTLSDKEGRYSIKILPFHTLVFTFVGYEKQKIMLKDQKVLDVTLEDAKASVLDQVVVTATGEQKKISVTGAITTVDVEQLKANPSTSMADALAGNVPGIQAMQTSGRPGSVSEFWVRSISTFGASNSALVLIDGFERDLNEINVEDVASFTVLKDASATAIYGSKGANGVLLITTKKGKGGKVNINGKVEGFYSELTKLPDFADGYTYASLANEAKEARNEEPLFSKDELEILRLGLDPDLFPNVDWMDVLLRNGAKSQRSLLNVSGGGNTARYYISGSYQDQQGMYKVDDALKEYNTNTNFKKYTYRLSVDMDITKSTLLTAGISGSLRKQNDPGVGSNSIWTALMGYNPITSPMMYSDGKIPSDGDDNGDRFNPWVQGTMTGYNESWQNNIQTTLNLRQRLDFITKGLTFIGRFGYDTYNSNYILRKKHPELWKASRYRNTNGELVFQRVVEEQKMEQSSGSEGDKREFLEWQLNYDRTIGVHNFGAVAKYSQSGKVFTQNIGDDLKNGIAQRNQGLAGRVNYNYKSRYFIDFNFGYTGSENFHKDYRFGFFPAISGAWNIGEEPWLKNASWIDMFKIRYSYGRTGNDNLGDVRFPYLYTIEQNVGGYNFADFTSDNTWSGIHYSAVASPNVSWEIATKQDLGIDYSFFNDKFNGAVDYFYERRTGIYMARNYLPGIVGLESVPSANVGEVLAKGFDGNFSFKQTLGKVELTIRGNITYSKNKIIEKDEENSIYWYKLEEGHRVNQARGLISLGLFKDYDDIRNSPRQTFSDDVMPGDIKYKDVNGDGIIDDNDRVAIGATTKPNLTYGFGVSASWKGFDVNVHFQGVGKSTYFIEGSTVYMFSTGDGWGNILNEMANGNRWILGVNEDPNADYPRLTYGANANNNRASTFWLRDGSYMRLKTLDMGYSLPKSLINKAHLNNARIFFIGTNLLTFTGFKLWDPELGSTNGKVYPLSKTFSLGLSVTL
ncbi:TonB-linked outer membrane protein, SusC/RagA family [Arachidicoccus rhizosphaerae]|jgi:TonB-linked SusC/RagA family outer membrane protein|uniref:TonB-linked outer membrane protein, SusC/RagA family n=1 Tax=Arachidicoccus rhizosphaerae TaxID=551991 RepID=A0A1H3VLN7_9BACT|nr:TonB-dependent receptor [Arachidicoccus rhizosphaerae]SDZ75669.1 TonB-linked outer membrane protein, SusC/RagA family [Arachidicoccus rhizosphaerae]